MTSDLLLLAERCEQATGVDLALIRDIANHAQSVGLLSVGDVIPNYTASLDAAMTLVPEGFVSHEKQWFSSNAAAEHAADEMRGGYATDADFAAANALAAFGRAMLRAQGTEARRAETTGSACDGPVAEGDAPNENQSASRLGEGL
jgi:hypothetical protein